MRHGVHYIVNALSVFPQIHFLSAPEMEDLWVLGM